MVDLTDALLVAFAFPLCLSGVVLLVLWRPWKRAAFFGEWRGACALGACYLAAYFATEQGLPAFPPGEVIDKLFYLALAIVVFGLADEPRAISGRARWFSRILLVASVVAVLIQPLVNTNDWSTLESSAKFAGLIVLGLLEWILVDRALSRTGSATALTMLVGMSAGTAVVLASGVAKLGLLSSALTAALVAYIGFALARSKVRLDRGAATVAILLLMAMWMVGYFYGEAMGSCIVILAAVPWLALVAEIGWLRRRAWWQSAAVFVLTLGPVALAMYLEIDRSRAAAYGL